MDFSQRNSHVTVDRKIRTERIEKTIGIGKAVAIAPDRKHRNCFNILTDTGVFIVQDYNHEIITLWVSSMNQAIDLYKRATGFKELPQKLSETIKKNNTSANKKFYGIAA